MNSDTQKGFSLIELAVVVFIVSLLLGGLLMPLSSQIEVRKRSDALDQLATIKDALVGFAIIHGRLPCYTSEKDPASQYYGVEDSANPSKSCDPTAMNEDGILPWKTLGLTSGLDPWGIERTGSTDPWVGYWRYRVDSKFFGSTPFVLTDDTVDNLSVVDANDNPLTGSEHPVVIIYSTGPNRTADGQNATYEKAASDNPTYEGGSPSGKFDDITGWISRPLLFARMVTAGTLP